MATCYSFLPSILQASVRQAAKQGTCASVDSDLELASSLTRKGHRIVRDTEYDIIKIVTRAGRLFDSMKANPKSDWTPENVRTVVRAHGLTLRQRGTRHAVITNAQGRHSTIPMHKPIKPVYIRRLVELIEEAR